MRPRRYAERVAAMRAISGPRGVRATNEFGGESKNSCSVGVRAKFSGQSEPFFRKRRLTVVRSNRGAVFYVPVRVPSRRPGNNIRPTRTERNPFNPFRVRTTAYNAVPPLSSYPIYNRKRSGILRL